MTVEYIKDFYGRKIGSYTTDTSGKITVKDFYGRIVGYYDPKTDTTKNFYGQVVARGNQVGMLLK